MSTDTAKPTEQGEWVPLLSGDWDITTDLQDVQLVFVSSTTADDFDEDLKRAMRDPANVLIVSAYPAVVEACRDAEISLAICQMPRANESVASNKKILEIVLESLRTALSAVHPEGGKT